MAVLHLIPDDDQPHAPTTECGCDLALVTVLGNDGEPRPAIRHRSPDDPADDPDFGD